MARQTGTTTQQIIAAPKGAIYVWVNRNTRYPRQIAAQLGRHDIQFVGPHWLDPMYWRGMKIPAVILDHALYLSGTQLEYYADLQGYISQHAK